MPLNWESTMDGFELMQVRDLHGEDLDLLARACPAARIRFLVEAEEMLACTDDADVLVISEDGEVCAAAAAGYHSRLDDVRIVTARASRDQRGLRRLLADIEARSVRRRCFTLVSAVDVMDKVARRTFELLGYVVTGAGVALWSERTTPGPPECSADTWTVRKEIASVPARKAAARLAEPGPAVAPPRPAPDDDLPDELRTAD